MNKENIFMLQWFFPPMLEKFESKSFASNNSIHSQLWFIMWWIISISFPVPLNQPTTHPSSFHFSSSENGFHWNLFCDNIFILSTLLLCASVCCWQWLSMAFLMWTFFVCFVLTVNKNVTEMMLDFSTACTYTVHGTQRNLSHYIFTRS